MRSARLAFFQGDVKIASADNTSASTAVLNMPLAQGVRITTGSDGQAEIEFEDGSLIRLTPYTSLLLTSLSTGSDANQTDLSLLNGLAYAELRASSKYPYHLDADGDVISPLQNATIRIDLDTPPATIAVLDGTAHIERPGAAGYHSDIQSGETFRADASDTSRYFLTVGITPNSWDAWNQDRDQLAASEADHATTARDDYAGSQGYGWSDLDANGSWYDVPGQGRVWQPDVAQDPDFDPYGYGAWVWYPGTGYVWASGYSWGWTPFRCGGWSYWDNFGWGWAPGASCGYPGWGFGAGGVYSINIVQPPRGYRLLPLPGRSPAGVHPIVPIRIGHLPERPIQPREGPVTIAGQTVQPLAPLHPHPGSVNGEAAPIGASLRRDYPVDRTTHQPVLGQAVTPGQSPALTPRPVRPGAYADRPQPERQPSGNTGQVPRYNTPPPPRPAPPPRSSPPPSAPRSAPASRPK
jgi:hypothetical protein